MTTTLTLSQIIDDPATLLALVGESVAPTAADIARANIELANAFDLALTAAQACSAGQISWASFVTYENAALIADHQLATLAALVQ